MTIRKTAVMRSSTVRTQAGGDDISCGVEDVGLLSLVTLFEVGFPGAGKAGGDRDTSFCLDRSMRGRILVRMSRRWVGTWHVQVSEFVLGRRDSTVVENAMVASKAATSGKGFIFSGSPESEHYKDGWI